LEGTATFGGKHDHTKATANITQDALIEYKWCQTIRIGVYDREIPIPPVIMVVKDR